MAIEGQIHILLPILVGTAIGIVEGFWVYQDERNAGAHQVFADMIHGMIFCIVGVLVATNVPYILAQGWFPSFLENVPGFIDSNGNSLIISILITLFMMIKMVSTRKIRGAMMANSGFNEKFIHKIIIALAVGFAPYYIVYLYEPLLPVAEALPWLPL